MTAIAWAIFIAILTFDPNMKTASEPAKNIAFGLCTFGMFSMIVLTIKDIMK